MKLPNRPLALAMLCALMTVSCDTAASVDSGGYKIATAAPEANVLTIFNGTAQAQINGDGTACVFIAWRTSRTAIVWPTGYTARGNPLAVYDGRGEQVLVAGEKLFRTLTQPFLGWGQVLSNRARNVKGCSGFSQSVAIVPTPPRNVANPGPKEYDELQIGKMQSVVNSYRDIFGGLVGDPRSHVITIYVATTADPGSVAQAKASLFSATAASNGFGSLNHWRVGFVVEGPSLATLDGVLNRLQVAQPWGKDVGAKLMGWGIDPVLHKVRIRVLEITPAISADARAAFGDLAVLETAEPLIPL
ncbi:MAG: hypothetical protein AUI42_05660 [Actinobacteria bacterium 13_1_40CM_2_65_8]|nr:MAG: hypothetical protein AUI42_05660 [Actinobacteria bacterium 13_1_40CM_2_65_8]